jgi:hypothetical protein
MDTPDSLSYSFYHPYQIAFVFFDTSIEFIRVKGFNWHTFWGLNPNFRVGQLLDF